MSSSADALRNALRFSMTRPELATNQHWLARLVIGAWAFHIPLFALLARESMLGRALDAAGAPAFAAMALLLLLSGLAIVDSAVRDGRRSALTHMLRRRRHLGFSVLAGVLTITGAAISFSTRTPALLTTFLLPALFCVGVTAADFHARLREIHR